MAMTSNMTTLKRWVAAQRARFVSKSPDSDKKVLHLGAIKFVMFAAVCLFVGVVCLMPDDRPVEFTEKLARPDPKDILADSASENAQHQVAGQSALWARPQMQVPKGERSASQVNYAAPMLVNSKAGNSKTQVRAGERLHARILDKFIVSQDAVPILAELITDGRTESGLKIPAGTRLYGEAMFQRDSERATVHFKQLSLPSGQIRPVAAIALGKDGQPGIEGKVHSDGVKNATGQFVTEFVSGLASGSLQTDIFGRSQGGLQNGLLSAVAITAKDHAQSYGEKLKAERQWIEVPQGTECEVLLSDAYLIQESGDQ